MTSPRSRALGDELVRIHAGLRAQLATLLAGGAWTPELGEHCVLFCDAVGAHHDNEAGRGFPLLLNRFPELAPALELIAREHATLAVLLAAVRDVPRGTDPQPELRRLATELDAHFAREERLLVAALNNGFSVVPHP